jgi:hypothetical protein
MAQRSTKRAGNILLFTGLTLFMIMFTIVSIMGNIASQSIDGPSGVIFVVSSIMIILGLFL